MLLSTLSQFVGTGDVPPNELRSARSISVAVIQEKGRPVVPQRKQNSGTWSEVKLKVAEMSHKDLVKLIGDLYRLSRENQAFLRARFSVGQDPLAPYKKTIEKCMYPNVYSDKPVQVHISEAKKAISGYSKAIGDKVGEAELMTFFVECGNSFTVDYGDMDEDFYYALESMYRRAIDNVLNLPQEQRDDFQDRLRDIMTSCGNIGWGYHDTLRHDYFKAFPEDE